MYKDVESGLAVIKQQKLCCMYHRASQCGSKNCCQKCGSKHHTSICNNSASATTATLTSFVPPQLTRSTVCLLKTAIATVVGSGSQVEFDKGSRRSFLTEKLATTLVGTPHKSKNIKSQSPQLPIVRQLRLFLDGKGLTRCCGRIHNTSVAELARLPYLLPTKHALTSLVICKAHENQLHAGVHEHVHVYATMIALHQMYWISCGRQRMKALLRTCVRCKLLVGDIPFSR